MMLRRRPRRSAIRRTTTPAPTKTFRARKETALLVAMARVARATAYRSARPRTQRSMRRGRGRYRSRCGPLQRRGLPHRWWPEYKLRQREITGFCQRTSRPRSRRRPGQRRSSSRQRVTLSRVRNTRRGADTPAAEAVPGASPRPSSPASPREDRCSP